MQAEARRIEVERGYELHSRRERERVEERKQKRNDARPKFGLSDVSKKYVRGLDKLDFVWNDGWEPATLFCGSVEGPQRDPDGNVWVKQGGEWVLESEV